MTFSASLFARRIEECIRQHRLLSPNDTVIVALSGGADSVALLDILSNLAGYSFRLIAAHLNHCLRGDESDGDEKFCGELAARYAVPFETDRIDIRSLAAQLSLNLEDAGRRSRMAFLDGLLHRYDAAAVAVAHHADDQAETVLMRLLRGSGMAGLSGMSYSNGRRYIRPLLDVSRTEIERYLTERGMEWREDSSNRDTSIVRNRIRHLLLPLLEQYNPAIRSCLTATAAILAEEDELLSGLADSAYSAVCHWEGDSIVCSVPQLILQPLPLQRRVLRLSYRRLTGTLEGFSRRHIEALRCLIMSAHPGSRLSLPNGVAAVREYERLMLTVRRAVIDEVQCGIQIAAPGSYSLENGTLLSVESVDTVDFSGYPDVIYLDPEIMPFPWLLRHVQPGDRMRPLGMSGSRKVKDIFIDGKIPLSERKRIPLLYCRGELLWIAGVRLSESCRVSGEFTRVMKVSFTR